jgi:glycosyltransferase involved in cell wall biosynthesis
MKKLTIAIPIYNGAKTIKRLLDCIFSQNFSIDEVDVIICDNGSTDNTLEVIKPYQSKFTLYKNETNLGADKNFELCVTRSKSEYVWILGDDDYLKDNAVNQVLSKIGSNTYACIFINFSLYDIKIQKEVLSKYVNINDDITAKGISEFLEHTNIAANFLSSIIHNKNAFQSIDCTQYYNTHFLQFAVILDYVNDNNALIIADPLVINMGDSSERDVNIGGGAVKIAYHLFSVVRHAKSKHINEGVRKKILDTIYRTLKYRILSGKRLGLKLDKPLLKNLINNFGGYWSFWTFDIFLLFIPNFIVILIYKLYRVKWVNYILTRFLKIR